MIMTKEGKVPRSILILEPTGVSLSLNGIWLPTVINSGNALPKIEKYFETKQLLTSYSDNYMIRTQCIGQIHDIGRSLLRNLVTRIDCTWSSRDLAGRRS